MSESPPVSSAESLRRITNAWREKHPKRAFGGAWALSGFSYQAARYLFAFYRNLIAERPLPTIEDLSDIVCPADGGLLHVVQVKRTLTRETLRHTLEEFCEILTLIEGDPLTGGFPSLRFQVACKRREMNVSWPWPADAALADDIRALLPEIEQRAADPFLIDQADPIEELWALLWLQGLRDPQAAIQQAAGRLLDSFGRQDLIPAVHRDLVSFFEQAQRRREGPRAAKLISSHDVAPDPLAADLNSVVVGGGFGFRQLREGCFRDRPKVFEALGNVFELWWRHLQNRLGQREVPVFWIDGRSGDGKSVLLRQLVADLVLHHADRCPVVEVHRDKLPNAIQESQTIVDRQILLMVDDPYAVADRETWGDALSAAVESDIASVAIVACGPTEQREEFERQFTQPFQVTAFTVPHLDDLERQEFVSWFRKRTGRQGNTRLTKNALLVHIMFELEEGTTLAEFARRFRLRLHKARALGAAERILSLAALYLETPWTLLTGRDERDAIDRLSEKDQSHFRQTAKGVDFGHAHLAGEVLRPILEASYPNVPWEIALARVVAGAVESPALETRFRRTLIARMVTTRRLEIVERKRALQELYSLHVSALSGTPDAGLLPVWLTAMNMESDLALEPSPIEQTLAAMARCDGTLPATAAISLWRLADRASINHEVLNKTCWDFVRSTSSAVAVVGFLRASSGSEQLFRSRATDWLAQWGIQPQAYVLLATLVAGDPQNADIRTRALTWLDANSSHLQAYWLLATVVARCSDADLESTLRRGFPFLESAGPVAKARVLGAMVVRSKFDPRVVDAAIDFARSASPQPQRSFVIHSLSKACSYNMVATLDYIESRSSQIHRRQAAVAVGMALQKWPDRLTDLEAALQSRPSGLAFEVLRVCVQRLQTPEFSRLVSAALKNHFRRPGYGFFLSVLQESTALWRVLEPQVTSGVREDYSRVRPRANPRL